jgi:hypothetical protein
MHEPADTEPGRKTAGTVVILAGDTIGAVARISWETMTWLAGHRIWATPA